MALTRMPGARAAPFYKAAFGPLLGRCFGLAAVPFLATPEAVPYFALTRLSATARLRPRRWLPAQPACLVLLQLVPAQIRLRRPGRVASQHECEADRIGIEMLDESLLLSFPGAFDCLCFYIHRRFLDETASLAGHPGGCTPCCRHNTRDEVLSSIGQAMLPLLATPELASPVFLAHLARSVALRLVRSYHVQRAP